MLLTCKTFCFLISCRQVVVTHLEIGERERKHYFYIGSKNYPHTHTSPQMGRGKTPEERAHLEAVTQETKKIMETGIVHLNICGLLDISVKEKMNQAIRLTKLYHHTKPWPLPYYIPKRDKTRFQLTGRSGIGAAYDLWKRGVFNVVVLNFANGSTPGGGFEHNSVAQEEDLARASCLIACIKQDKCKEMYAFNRSLGDKSNLASDYMIYSPSVPVFRDGNDQLVIPYYVSFITSPACDIRFGGPADKTIHDMMYQRIKKILQLALHHNHRHIVLGAFGCGVFGNDPKDVANYFLRALRTEFANCFEEVVFAFKARDSNDKNYNAFLKVFAPSDS